MTKKIHPLFDENDLIKKIKEKLPYLFQLAEIDNSRDGKLGIEMTPLNTIHTIDGWNTGKSKPYLKVK